MINRVRDAFELLRRTPAGKQALEEHEREIGTDRELHVAAIEEAEAHLVAELPKLNDAVAKADAQWERARKAAEEAEATHRDARLALNSAVHRAEHARETHQQALAEGADPRIPNVVFKLRTLYLKESKGGLIWEYEKTGLFSAMPGRYPNAQVSVSNNSAARLRRMVAMHDAIHTIEALKFHHKADVSQEVRAILEGIPDGTALEFQYKGYESDQIGRNTIDLYLPISVTEDFPEVLTPAEFVSRDNDGGSGGTGSGADFPEGMPSGIPMAR